MPPKAPSSRGEYIETVGSKSYHPRFSVTSGADSEKETGNKISRRATILGPKHIMLAGKCVIQENVLVHGDLVRPSQPKSTPVTKDDSEQKSKSTTQDATSVHLGRYVFISHGCILHPPSRMSSSGTSSGSSNGEQAAPVTALTYYPLRLSDHIYIGPNTVVRAAEIRSNVYIGANCVIGNMVIIKDNVKVLDGSVLPANSVWASGSIVAGSPARVVGDLGEAWGSSAGGAGGAGDEGPGVKSRERWASVGNKR